MVLSFNKKKRRCWQGNDEPANVHLRVRHFPASQMQAIKPKFIVSLRLAMSSIFCFTPRRLPSGCLASFQMSHILHERCGTKFMRSTNPAPKARIIPGQPGSPATNLRRWGGSSPWVHVRHEAQGLKAALSPFHPLRPRQWPRWTLANRGSEPATSHPAALVGSLETTLSTLHSFRRSPLPQEG
jgi:hypothetical protein